MSSATLRALHDHEQSHRPSTQTADLPFFVARYHHVLSEALQSPAWQKLETLGETLLNCWMSNRQVFLCGNGGSATNAVHLANDLMLGLRSEKRDGLRATALSANPAVMTCLANDIGYEKVFGQQLLTLGQRGDVLICFSGSGNSPNILNALQAARGRGITSFAVVGFDGGKSKDLADHPLHFEVNDMQVAEDLQTMVGHITTQWLARATAET